MAKSTFPTSSISLDGEWSFSLGAGSPPSRIMVPGCWEAQGFSKHVEGPAVYRRNLPPLPDRGEARVVLEMDAVSYACTVSVNGRAVGKHEGMWTPFTIDLTDTLTRDGESSLEIEVWKPGTRYPVRESLAGFLPDVATTFGGLWQSCRLLVGRSFLRDVTVTADCASKEIRLHAETVGDPGAESGRIEMLVMRSGSVVARTRLTPDAHGMVHAALAVPIAVEWSPRSPQLYEVRIVWTQRDTIVAQWSGKTGFRQLETRGDQLFLNGHPFLVRGALSWGWDPRRIAPNFDRESIRKELALVRELGFNLVKLCLFIPNQELYDLADEEGMLLWQELPLWLPEVSPELAARAPVEYAQYARGMSRHPSVVLYTLGCEMSSSVTPELIKKLDDAVRPLVRGALVCDNPGSGESYGGWDTDRADFTDYHPYYDMHWFEPLLDNWRRDWKSPRPWIFGEFCDQDAFRDRAALIASAGGAVPWWMTKDLPVATWRPEAQALLEADERMARANIGVPVDRIVSAANAHALVSRKYTLEALRRRSGIGGYVVTGLDDTPISTSGILDDWRRPRWTPSEITAFNGDTVLCLDVPRRRSWTHGGDRPSRIDPHAWWAGDTASWTVVASSFVHPIPAGARVTWRLEYPDGTVCAQGQAATSSEIPVGIARSAANVEAALPAVTEARQLRLHVELEAGDGRTENSWPVWTFPRPRDLSDKTLLYDPSFALDGIMDGFAAGARVTNPSDLDANKVVIAAGWDESLHSFLRAGGRVVFWQLGVGPLPAARGPFWREAVPLFAAHPLWDRFPHGESTDMQFFGLATDVMLDARGLGTALGPDATLTPMLRRLDARSFLVHEYLVEVRQGTGRMFVTSLRFHGGAGAQPSGFLRNVAGHSLLASLVETLLER